MMKDHPGKYNSWVSPRESMTIPRGEAYIRSWWEESELPVVDLIYKARCLNQYIKKQRAFCL